MTLPLSLTSLDIYQAHRHILHIDNVSVQRGEFIAVLGPNGAGKTSLFRAITTEWPARAGTILLHGRDIHHWSRRERAQHLGVLPQATQLTFPFSAREVVEIGAIPLHLPKMQLTQQLRQWMKKTDTWQFADRLYTSLSGGERQRVQLARVLLQLSQAEMSPLLLLDEPTSAQDLGQQHHVLQLVRQLSQEQHFSVVAILHDLNQAARYADNIWILNQGKLVAQGAPHDILTPTMVQSVWDYLPEQLSTHNGYPVLI